MGRSFRGRWAIIPQSDPADDTRRSTLRSIRLPAVSRWLPWLSALAIVVVFVGLGRWQLERADFKQALIERGERVLAERDAIALSRAVEVTEGIDWAGGGGVFLDRPELLLDNQVREGRAGLRSYRLFRPDGADRPLLVDLGWLPWSADRRPPDSESVVGRRQLVGLMLPPPRSGLRLGPVGQPLPDGRWLLTRIDPEEIAAVLALPGGLSARVLRPDPADPIGHARDFDLLPNTLPPEKHRGYAVQWFALAAAVLVLASILAWRGRISRRPR